MREVEAEVRQAYADYVSCFQRLNPCETASYFTVPLVRLGGGRVTVLDSPSSVRTMLGALADRLRGHGYAGARTDALDVDVLDGTVALVRATGRRVDGDGVAFERFDVAYTWVRPGRADPWRIAMLIPVLDRNPLSP